jgi:chromosome segregation ATPase
MSKTKIVEEHENALAALQGLSLPPESNPLVKRIDRAFKELRGLHSETERDRQELSRRVAHLEEYLNNAIRDVRAARVRIDSLENQAICLASNIAARMSGQESKSKLDAEIAAFQQKLPTFRYRPEGFSGELSAWRHPSRP